MARRISKLIAVAELAEAQGVDETTALRWLHSLDETTRGGVIVRVTKGRRKVYTTLAALRAADRRLVEEDAIAAEELEELKRANAEKSVAIRTLAARVRKLETRLAALEERLSSAAK